MYIRTQPPSTFTINHLVLSNLATNHTYTLTGFCNNTSPFPTSSLTLLSQAMGSCFSKQKKNDNGSSKERKSSNPRKNDTHEPGQNNANPKDRQPPKPRKNKTHEPGKKTFPPIAHVPALKHGELAYKFVLEQRLKKGRRHNARVDKKQHKQQAQAKHREERARRKEQAQTKRHEERADNKQRKEKAQPKHQARYSSTSSSEINDPVSYPNGELDDTDSLYRIDSIGPKVQPKEQSGGVRARSEG